MSSKTVGLNRLIYINTLPRWAFLLAKLITAKHMRSCMYTNMSFQNSQLESMWVSLEIYDVHYHINMHTHEYTPIQEQLQYTLYGGKGPVRGEEDAGVCQVIITERCEECLYQALKCPCPDTPDLTRLQLTDRVTWG